MRIDLSGSRLQQRQAMDWGVKVQLIFGDMRVIDVPEKADILVSELLGSFGDNELSPECLDGASRFLKGRCVAPCHRLVRFDNSIVRNWDIDSVFVHSTSSSSFFFEIIQRS